MPIKFNEKNRTLSSTPSSREARDRIADYANAALMGQTFTIKSRGKVVAILAPPNALPEDLQIQAEVQVTEIKNGKRGFTGVALHGPYAVTRGGVRVAVLYPETRGLQQQVARLLAKLDEMKIIEAEISRRVEIRRRADAGITDRIQLLRERGETVMAAQIEASHGELQRQL